MLKRLLIAGAITSATLVSVPAAAHSNVGERIAAEIILHSVFGDRHGHSVRIHDSRDHFHRGERHHESVRAERLRRELAQARQDYRRALARLDRRESRRTARYDHRWDGRREHRREARRDDRRHERGQNRELAALRIRDAQLSAQLAALVNQESEAPRGRTGPRGGGNK